ncbi:MAG TPA: metallophosphoesterase family protein [bacterium]|nr:metallophosphoesterase family protein [bacterium]
MRYAIFSDVHANLEALEAVLAEAGSGRPDAYVCLGDVVGYGPDPNECAARVRDLGAATVAGNHDRAALGAVDLDTFSALARAAIEWTQTVLLAETRTWLAALPLRRDIAGGLAVHGSPRDPIEEYILDLPAALANFSAAAFTCCFVGHTHIPGAFVLEPDGRVGTVTLPPGSPVRLRPDARYIVNVGSVGQPRDGDPRASYLILDADAGTVTLRRVSYALATTQAKMAARDLPSVLAQRLALGR